MTYLEYSLDENLPENKWPWKLLIKVTVDSDFSKIK